MNSKIRAPNVLLMRVAHTCRTLAMTNDGTESINSEVAVKNRSDGLYCRVAVQAPVATPTAMPSREPMVSSRRLTQIRRLTSSLTLPPVGASPQSQ